MDVIKTADWIIDLGPEGGDNGGMIVAEGTPEQIAENPHSYTGHHLKKELEKWFLFHDTSEISESAS